MAFLSSRRVAPAVVMRCYDWATGMRGGGGSPGGSAGRLAPPGDGDHAGRGRVEFKMNLGMTLTFNNLL